MKRIFLEKYDKYVYYDEQKVCYNIHKLINVMYVLKSTEYLEKGRIRNYRIPFVVEV